MLRKLPGRLYAIAGVILLAVIPAMAHHGSAAYDNTKMTTLTGTVTDFQFIQPHPLIFLDVKDANGNIEKWFVEMTAPNHLIHYGWNGHKLHQGDMIKVTGQAAKDGRKVLNLRKIYNSSGQEIPLGPPPPPGQS